MSPTGRFYLVAVEENDVPGIRSRMRERYGLQSEVGWTGVNFIYFG